MPVSRVFKYEEDTVQQEQAEMAVSLTSTCNLQALNALLTCVHGFGRAGVSSSEVLTILIGINCLMTGLVTTSRKAKEITWSR